jgi:hypothetical protein
MENWWVYLHHNTTLYAFDADPSVCSHYMNTSSRLWRSRWLWTFWNNFLPTTTSQSNPDLRPALRQFDQYIQYDQWVHKIIRTQGHRRVKDCQSDSRRPSFWTTLINTKCSTVLTTPLLIAPDLPMPRLVLREVIAPSPVLVAAQPLCLIISDLARDWVVALVTAVLMQRSILYNKLSYLCMIPGTWPVCDSWLA